MSLFCELDHYMISLYAFSDLSVSLMLKCDIHCSAVYGIAALLGTSQNQAPFTALAAGK